MCHLHTSSRIGHDVAPMQRATCTPHRPIRAVPRPSSIIQTVESVSVLAASVIRKSRRIAQIARTSRENITGLSPQSGIPNKRTTQDTISAYWTPMPSGPASGRGGMPCSQALPHGDCRAQAHSPSRLPSIARGRRCTSRCSAADGSRSLATNPCPTSRAPSWESASASTIINKKTRY